MTARDARSSLCGQRPGPYSTSVGCSAQFHGPPLPLAVRFAGLDRDPGWIPAAGCDVRFHFH